MQNTHRAIIVVGATLIILGGGAWWYLQSKSSSSLTTAQDVFKNTYEQNTDFASGTQLMNANKYAESIPYFERALVSAQNDDEKTLAGFYLAAAYRGTGKYAAAINTLQNVANTWNQARGVQALAVEEMATIFANHIGTSTKNALFDETLYKSFIASSTNATIRRVYLYAASLYPLPLSNYAIARTYANSIIGLKDSTAADKEATAAELMQRLKSAVAAGDAGTTAEIQRFTYPAYQSQALLERAVVLDKLQELGDTSLGDAGEAYQKAIDSYVSTGASDATARLKYASYLARVYGAQRSADIATLLAPLYQGARGDQGFDYVFSRYGESEDGRRRANLVELGKIDPGFKTYLISLGWSEADFK